MIVEEEIRPLDMEVKQLRRHPTYSRLPIIVEEEVRSLENENPIEKLQGSSPTIADSLVHTVMLPLGFRLKGKRAEENNTDTSTAVDVDTQTQLYPVIE